MGYMDTILLYVLQIKENVNWTKELINHEELLAVFAGVVGEFDDVAAVVVGEDL